MALPAVAGYLVTTGIVASIGSTGAAAVGTTVLAAGTITSGGVGGAIAHKISDSIESDIWKERTET